MNLLLFIASYKTININYIINLFPVLIVDFLQSSSFQAADPAKSAPALLFNLCSCGSEEDFQITPKAQDFKII